MTCDREAGRRLWCCRVHASFRVTYGCGLRGSQQGERLWGSRGCRAPAALVLSRSSTWLSLARHSGSHGIILPPLFLTKRFKTLDWALICKLGAPPLPIILLVACSLGSGRGFPGVCRCLRARKVAVLQIRQRAAKKGPLCLSLAGAPLLLIAGEGGSATASSAKPSCSSGMN